MIVVHADGNGPFRRKRQRLTGEVLAIQLELLELGMGIAEREKGFEDIGHFSPGLNLEAFDFGLSGIASQLIEHRVTTLNHKRNLHIPPVDEKEIAVERQPVIEKNGAEKQLIGMRDLFIVWFDLLRKRSIRIAAGPVSLCIFRTGADIFTKIHRQTGRRQELLKVDFLSGKICLAQKWPIK